MWTPVVRIYSSNPNLKMAGKMERLVLAILLFQAKFYPLPYALFRFTLRSMVLSL